MRSRKGKKSKTISPGYLLSAICVRKGGRNLRLVLLPHIPFVSHGIFAWAADFFFFSFLPFVGFHHFSRFVLAIFLFILVYFGMSIPFTQKKNCWPYLLHTVHKAIEHNHLKWFSLQLIYQGVKSLVPSMYLIHQVKINCANVYVCIIRCLKFSLPFVRFSFLFPCVGCPVKIHSNERQSDREREKKSFHLFLFCTVNANPTFFRQSKNVF